MWNLVYIAPSAYLIVYGDSAYTSAKMGAKMEAEDIKTPVGTHGNPEDGIEKAIGEWDFPNRSSGTDPRLYEDRSLGTLRQDEGRGWRDTEKSGLVVQTNADDGACQISTI